MPRKRTVAPEAARPTIDAMYRLRQTCARKAKVKVEHRAGNQSGWKVDSDAL